MLGPGLGVELSGTHRVRVTGAMLMLPAVVRGGGYLAIDEARISTLEPERARRLDPLSQLALIAIEGARHHAGLPYPGDDSQRESEGVVVGSALGAVTTSVRYARRLVGAGSAATNPIDFPDSIDGAPAAHVALALGLGGPSLTVANGAASAVAALVQAARQIAWGRATRMHVIVGDKFDPLLAEAMVRDPEFASRIDGVTPVPAECVFALVLERKMLQQGQSLFGGRCAVELVGHLDGSTPLPAADVAAPEGDDASDAATWTEQPSWRLDSANQLQLFDDGDARCAALRAVSDPSGALALAGAWLRVAGPTAANGGAVEPAVPAPIAERVRCGTPTHARLGFVAIRTP